MAHIAQSVEHFLGKEEVTGSNPVMGSNLASLQCGIELSDYQKILSVTTLNSD
tara:strand:+ start:435 stop:593 length:159 start_codon:yes stop_codon:yes gene_type:complete